MEAEQLHPIPCERCKKEFEVSHPKMNVIQNVELSMLIWMHPMTQDCPYCGMPHQMMISKVGQIAIMWKGIEKKEQNRIVPATVMPNLTLPK